MKFCNTTEFLTWEYSIPSKPFIHSLPDVAQAIYDRQQLELPPWEILKALVTQKKIIERSSYQRYDDEFQYLKKISEIYVVLEEKLQQFVDASLAEDSIYHYVRYYIQNFSTLQSLLETFIDFKEKSNACIAHIIANHTRELTQKMIQKKADEKAEKEAADAMAASFDKEDKPKIQKKKKKKKKFKSKAVLLKLVEDIKRSKPLSTCIPSSLKRTSFAYSFTSLKPQWPPLTPEDLSTLFARKPQQVTLDAYGKTFTFQSRFLSSALNIFLQECVEHRISFGSSIASAAYHSTKHAPGIAVEDYIGCALSALFTFHDNVSSSPSLWDPTRRNGSLEKPYLIFDFATRRIITFESSNKKYNKEKAQEGIRQFLRYKETWTHTEKK